MQEEHYKYTSGIIIQKKLLVGNRYGYISETERVLALQLILNLLLGEIHVTVAPLAV